MHERTKHFLVSGRVQGVGFRAFVQSVASQEKLRGWVRNLNDGRVEILAQGPLASTKRLQESVQKGPQSAHVTQVEDQEITSLAFAWPKGFEIMATGEAPWV